MEEESQIELIFYLSEVVVESLAGSFFLKPIGCSGALEAGYNDRALML